jgi:hypothetical protein
LEVILKLRPFKIRAGKNRLSAVSQNVRSRRGTNVGNVRKPPVREPEELTRSRPCVEPPERLQRGEEPAFVPPPADIVA